MSRFSLRSTADLVDLIADSIGMIEAGFREDIHPLDLRMEVVGLPNGVRLIAQVDNERRVSREIPVPRSEGELQETFRTAVDKLYEDIGQAVDSIVGERIQKALKAIGAPDEEVSAWDSEAT